MQDSRSVPNSEVARETRRLLMRLRETVDDTQVTRREIERRAGFSPGYLAQLMAENIELKMVHVLAILNAVGRTPATFFRTLHTRPGEQEPVRLPSDQDVASVYGFGIESLTSLRQRLARFEDALSNATDPPSGPDAQPASRKRS